jgi:seryl-tRNA synthetase
MASDNESEVGMFTAEQFKETVKEYIRIYDRITDIRRDSSMLNKRKKKLSETIVSYMGANDLGLCNIGNDGSLQVKTSKSSLALKKEQVEQLLVQLGTNEIKAKETAQYLWDNKVVKERNVLKRNLLPFQ